MDRWSSTGEGEPLKMREGGREGREGEKVKGKKGGKERKHN